jgi:hypothetical protein
MDGVLFCFRQPREQPGVAIPLAGLPRDQLVQRISLRLEPLRQRASDRRTARADHVHDEVAGLLRLLRRLKPRQLSFCDIRPQPFRHLPDFSRVRQPRCGVEGDVRADIGDLRFQGFYCGLK